MPDAAPRQPDQAAQRHARSRLAPPARRAQRRDPRPGARLRPRAHCAIARARCRVSAAPPVLCDEPAPRVARLTLNRPERRNALADDLRELLIGELVAALADDRIRAVIVTGSGGSFCAG